MCVSQNIFIFYLINTRSLYVYLFLHDRRARRYRAVYRYLRDFSPGDFRSNAIGFVLDLSDDAVRDHQSRV